MQQEKKKNPWGYVIIRGDWHSLTTLRVLLEWFCLKAPYDPSDLFLYQLHNENKKSNEDHLNVSAGVYSNSSDDHSSLFDLSGRLQPIQKLKFISWYP